MIASHREDFAACVADWAGGEQQVDLSGLKVDLFITINPTGAVTRPTIANSDLERSALGGCLKAAGAALVFPPFEGEAFQVRVPLVLE